MCVAPQMSVLSSCLAHKPTPAAIAPLGSEQDASCCAHSWGDGCDLDSVCLFLKIDRSVVQCGSGVTHIPLSAVRPRRGSVLDHLQEMCVCRGCA